MKPKFFSKYEWWYHSAMMPVFFAVGNYYFIGPVYFHDPETFIVATLLVVILYWFSIVKLTLLIRWIINHYPGVDKTPNVYSSCCSLWAALRCSIPVKSYFWITRSTNTHTSSGP